MKLPSKRAALEFYKYGKMPKETLWGLKSGACFWILVSCWWIHSKKELEWNKDLMNKPGICGVRLHLIRFSSIVCDLHRRPRLSGILLKAPRTQWDSMTSCDVPRDASLQLLPADTTTAPTHWARLQAISPLQRRSINEWCILFPRQDTAPKPLIGSAARIGVQDKTAWEIWEE